MAVKVERFQPPGMDIRMQDGKAAYSHVVTVTGPGKVIFIAGQLARDAGGSDRRPRRHAGRNWNKPSRTSTPA